MPRLPSRRGAQPGRHLAASQPTKVTIADDFLTRLAGRLRPGVGRRRRTGSKPAGTGGRSRRCGRVDGTVPALPAVVARPADAARGGRGAETVPPSRGSGHGGRRGERGMRGQHPVFGGVALDMTGLTGILAVDDASLLVDVKAGTFGDPSRTTLQSDHSLTLGHWPQSMACPRSAAGSPAGARVSTRPGTARSRTWSSASRWRWPMAG